MAVAGMLGTTHTRGSVHPHHTPPRKEFLISFYPWGDGGTEKLNDLPKDTQLLRHRART